MRFHYPYLAVQGLGRESFARLCLDVVNPLAIWTGIGTGNEGGGIKMGFHSGYSWREGS